MIPDATAGFSIRPAEPQARCRGARHDRRACGLRKARPLCVASEADLQRGAMGTAPAAEVLVAWKGDEPAGFALFFHNYSTFLGRRGIWLEDLFVRPALPAAGVRRRVAARRCHARDRARLRPVRVVGARLERRRDRFLRGSGRDDPARLAHRTGRRSRAGRPCGAPDMSTGTRRRRPQMRNQIEPPGNNHICDCAGGEPTTADRVCVQSTKLAK